MLEGMGTPGDKQRRPWTLGCGVLGSEGKGSVGRTGLGWEDSGGSSVSVAGEAISPSLEPLVEKPMASECVIF